MKKQIDLSTPAKRQAALVKYCSALSGTAEIMADIAKLTKDQGQIVAVRKNSIKAIEELLADIPELLALVKADLDK